MSDCGNINCNTCGTPTDCGCKSITSTNCVILNGAGSSILGINSGDNLDTVISNLISQIETITNNFATLDLLVQESITNNACEIIEILNGSQSVCGVCLGSGCDITGSVGCVNPPTIENIEIDESGNFVLETTHTLLITMEPVLGASYIFVVEDGMATNGNFQGNEYVVTLISNQGCTPLVFNHTFPEACANPLSNLTLTYSCETQIITMNGVNLVSATILDEAGTTEIGTFEDGDSTVLPPAIYTIQYNSTPNCPSILGQYEVTCEITEIVISEVSYACVDGAVEVTGTWTSTSGITGFVTENEDYPISEVTFDGDSFTFVVPSIGGTMDITATDGTVFSNTVNLPITLCNMVLAYTTYTCVDFVGTIQIVGSLQNNLGLADATTDVFINTNIADTSLNWTTNTGAEFHFTLTFPSDNFNTTDPLQFFFQTATPMVQGNTSNIIQLGAVDNPCPETTFEITSLQAECGKNGIGVVVSGTWASNNGTPTFAMPLDDISYPLTSPAVIEGNAFSFTIDYTPVDIAIVIGDGTIVSPSELLTSTACGIVLSDVAVDCVDPEIWVTGNYTTSVGAIAGIETNDATTGAAYTFVDLGGGGFKITFPKTVFTEIGSVAINLVTATPLTAGHTSQPITILASQNICVPNTPALVIDTVDITCDEILAEEVKLVGTYTTNLLSGGNPVHPTTISTNGTGNIADLLTHDVTITVPDPNLTTGSFVIKFPQWNFYTPDLATIDIHLATGVIGNSQIIQPVPMVVPNNICFPIINGVVIDSYNVVCSTILGTPSVTVSGTYTTLLDGGTTHPTTIVVDGIEPAGGAGAYDITITPNVGAPDDEGTFTIVFSVLTLTTHNIGTMELGLAIGLFNNSTDATAIPMSIATDICDE